MTRMNIRMIKIARKHKVIIRKIYQFIQQTDHILSNIRKSIMMTSNKILLWHRHPTRYKIPALYLKETLVLCTYKCNRGTAPLELCPKLLTYISPRHVDRRSALSTYSSTKAALGVMNSIVVGRPKLTLLATVDLVVHVMCAQQDGCGASRGSSCDS